jgi:hypothetical protein
VSMSPSRRSLVFALALVLALLALGPPTLAWGLLSLEFGTAPTLPTLATVTLNAKSQIVSSTMSNFSVSDTRLTKSGWNVTVEGRSGAGNSAVFAQYCPKAKCGAASEGYVGAGATLVANSLKLNSSGASFTGGIGGAPTLECSVACNVDSSSAVKIASATASAGGTWTTTGWSATSLALAAPTTLKVLPNEEVYRVNILWTLASGP